MIKNNTIGNKIHHIGLIIRDNTIHMDVIKIRIKSHITKWLFFFVVLLSNFTEMPFVYNLISINYNFSLTKSYLDEIFTL